MQDERKFYEDIMIQNFTVGTFYNPTRYIMLYGMLSFGKLKTVYSKVDLVNYIYEAYCANKILATHHPKVEIRKIPFFGIDIFYKEIEEALFEWTHNAKNNILNYDVKNVYLDIEDDGHIAQYINKILNVLFVKNFGVNFKQYEKIDKDILVNDKDLYNFGQSAYRDSVFADMQYCVLCDDCDVNNLFAVHILNSQDTNNIEELSDPKNGLIMCKEHATQFNENSIKIDERGKFVFSNQEVALQNMRLPSKIYLSRKMYINKKNNIL